jgi:hypothetical protein
MRDSAARANRLAEQQGRLSRRRSPITRQLSRPQRPDELRPKGNPVEAFGDSGGAFLWIRLDTVIE